VHGWIEQGGLGKLRDEALPALSFATATIQLGPNFVGVKLIVAAAPLETATGPRSATSLLTPHQYSVTSVEGESTSTCPTTPIVKLAESGDTTGAAGGAVSMVNPQLGFGP
jgi:hypothetical protein